MAEATLIGIAQYVLNQLCSPSLKELMLAWNLNRDHRRLELTIESITNFLHDVEQREFNDRMIKGWLFRLRAVLYDADHLFDALASRALRKKALSGNAFKKEVHLFFSKSNHLRFVFRMAHDVKDLRERLDDIAKDMSSFCIGSKPLITQGNSTRLLDTTETHSFINVEYVVGRDKEKEDIIKLLLPEDHGEGQQEQKLSVVSILGFGGLGKTTLAQLVYNDERVQMGFDLCLWACVNYLSDLKEVLITILASILRSKPHDNTVDELQRELRKNIQDKKFLLVLDNVWDEESFSWHGLKPLLEFGKVGSKVLVTSRKRKVAQCLDAIEPYYHLNVLSNQSALSLFWITTFGEGDELGNNSKLLLLGEQIVSKCGYVPLALITIGSMLRYKKSEMRDWLSIVDQELAVALSDDTKDNIIMKVLMISYNDLPLAIKHCFAYCSLFPKDYTFDKDKLVRMWLAQGFLDPHANKSLEDVGDEYFFYLVDRCFFQEVKVYSRDGCLTCVCKMHDLLHDLAMQVAGWDSRRLFEDDLKSMDEKNTPLHISVNYDPNIFFRSFGESAPGTKLRTLLFSDKKPLETHSLDLESVLKSCRELHTLDLSYLNFEKLSGPFGKLIHLRYLDLSFNWDLKILPDSICELCHLQTLSLVGCRRLEMLPSKFGRLVSLRHLLIDGCNRLAALPSGLAGLTSLVTLDRVVVHHQDGGLRLLGQLDNLCGPINVELPTSRWSDVIEDARQSNLSMKKRLNGMTIKWVEPEEKRAHQMVKEETGLVLEALQPDNNLQYLNIEGHLADTLSSWVFSLSNLKELILKGCTVEYLDGNVWSYDTFLPCLEILQIDSLPNLKGWWRSATACRDNARMSCLPRVAKLVIMDCPKFMENMPVFKGIENLQLVKVNWRLFSELLIGNENSSLKELSLFDVGDLDSLPERSLRHLTALKSLKIELSFQLGWVSCSGLACLTSLEKLEIFNCGNVTLVNQDGVMPTEMPWKALQRLRVLDVPWQSHLICGLQYLTSLEELNICYLDNNQVYTDNENMKVPGMLWDGFGRLQKLTIKTVHNVCCFPAWIQHLRFLKYLSFCHCEELHMSWSVLASMELHTLSLVWVKKVVSVDPRMTEQQSLFSSLVKLRMDFIEEEGWIHDIPWNLFASLHTLELDSIHNMSCLPDGVRKLTSLQLLDIKDCRNMKAIPNWMVNLTSLQQLSITKCSPELAASCKPGSGSDWHLISHIPTLQIMSPPQKLVQPNEETEDFTLRILDLPKELRTYAEVEDNTVEHLSEMQVELGSMADFSLISVNLATSTEAHMPYSSSNPSPYDLMEMSMRKNKSTVKGETSTASTSKVTPKSQLPPKRLKSTKTLTLELLDEAGENARHGLQKPHLPSAKKCHLQSDVQSISNEVEDHVWKALQGTMSILSIYEADAKKAEAERESWLKQLDAIFVALKEEKAKVAKLSMESQNLLVILVLSLD